MAVPLVFWIDSANNKLAGGWNSFVSAPKPLFKQGDEVEVVLRWIKRPVYANSSMEEIPFGSSIINFEIGNRGWRPTAGKWYLQFDGENTELLDYNVSAEDLENILNTNPTVVSAGGVSVTRINSDGYKVVYAEDGAQSAPVGYGEGLSPISDIIVNTVSAGSASTKAVFYIYLRQSIVSSVTSDWDVEDSVIALAQEVKPDIWDVYLSGQPKDGYFKIAIDEGTPVSVSVFATQEDLEALVGEDYTVHKVGDYNWRIYANDKSAFDVSVTSSSDIISFSGMKATVLIDSLKAAEMLAGLSETNTTLQVSVINAERQDTILQTPCMVVGNLSL